mgnify:CR=1 FL=1
MMKMCLGLISWVLLFGGESFANVSPAVNSTNKCHGVYSAVAPKQDLTTYFFDLKSATKAKYFQYDLETLDQDFWNYHRRFSFVSGDGERVVLLTKNVFHAELFIQELIADAQKEKAPVQNKLQVPMNQIYFPLVDAVQVDVTNLLSEKIHSFLRLKTSRHGPNCWNSCLVYSKILDNIRYSPDWEIDFWLNSPFVQRINSVSSLRLGDILVFKQNNQQVHTAIYVSKNILLTKNGLTSKARYRLMDVREVVDLYLNQDGGEMQAYRVGDVAQFYKKIDALMPPLYFILIDKVESFEKQLADHFRQNSGPVDSDFLIESTKFIRAQADVVISYIEQLGGTESYFAARANYSKSEEDHLRLTAWMGLYMRLYSLSLPSNK